MLLWIVPMLWTLSGAALPRVVPLLRGAVPRQLQKISYHALVSYKPALCLQKQTISLTVQLASRHTAAHTSQTCQVVQMAQSALMKQNHACR